MTKMLIATASLLVIRDAMTILPVSVPAHEVDVMKALHGEENVRVLDGKTEPVELDGETEAERLEAKYGPGTLSQAYGDAYKREIPRAMKDAAGTSKKRQGAEAS